MRGSIWPAIVSSFAKLDPRQVARNPVMFVVEVGSVITTIAFVAGARRRAARTSPSSAWSRGWLWFTVLFANFAEAMAEGRGKAQADTLRKTKTETLANLRVDGAIEQVAAARAAQGRRRRGRRPARSSPATAT